MNRKSIITTTVLLLIIILSVFGLSSRKDESVKYMVPEINNEKLNVYFFWNYGCAYCDKEETYLKKLIAERDDINVYDYEISRSRDHVKLIQEVGKTLDLNISGVPITIIGDQSFIGFSDASSPAQFESRIEFCLIEENECGDSVFDIAKEYKTEGTFLEKIPVATSAEAADTDNVIGSNDEIVDDVSVGNENVSADEEASASEGEIYNIPILGEINSKKVSLPLLAITIGALDGFNPCAMWALIFLITLMLGLKDRKKMWILGSAFIVTSGVVYFMFMAAWLNLILFIGFIGIIRFIIGAIAMGGGLYSLKDAFKKEVVCEVGPAKTKDKILMKIKEMLDKKNMALALVGVIVLAGAVNLVELVCSAGFPVIFTQVLAMNNLSKLQYYGYMLLYIFFFILDDLIIFFVAMVTLKITGLTTKYTRLSRVIGGVLMLLIGLLLIFKHEWLMF